MIQSEKKLKELATVLKNGNPSVIRDAVETLRDELPFEGAIGLLSSYYNATDDHQIRKSIERFMNDIKDQAASVEVIREAKMPYREDTIRMIISSCWQSGLDYSEYSSEIADIFLKVKYITAIECFTVLEGSINNISDKKKDEIIKSIRMITKAGDDEKNQLALELIALFGG